MKFTALDEMKVRILVFNTGFYKIYSTFNYKYSVICFPWLSDSFTHWENYWEATMHKGLFRMLCTCSDDQWCWIFVTPWTMGFSRQEYWCELLFPPSEDLPDQRIKPMSPASPALASGVFTTELPGKPFLMLRIPITGKIFSLTTKKNQCHDKTYI